MSEVPTFIYQPAIKVYIDTINNGILDVSEDITNFTMVRRSDGVSTFDFALQNTRRKYDRVFTPNDRIIVMMKRIKWLRTFTGYLNSVPIFTVWPREVPLSASCSLKRLMYFYWDSTLSASQNLVLQHLQSAGATAQDGGIKNAALALLDKVVGWPAEKVHIGSIPTTWFDWATQIAKDVLAETAKADAFAAEMMGRIGAQPTVGGVAGGVITAGSYGGRTFSQEQCDFAAQIINTTFSLGMSDKAAIIAVATAMQESSLRNLSGGDRDSVGLFQQRPSQAWGTIEQCRDPVFATTSFLQGRGSNPGLVSISGWESLPVTVAAQKVQRSGYPSAYADDEGAATAMVQTFRQTAKPGGGSGPLIPRQLERNAAQAGTRGAAAFLQNTISLLNSNPPIPYLMGGGHAPGLWRTPNPKNLDCSGFVMWALAQFTGQDPGPFNSTAAGQASACQRFGTLRTDVEVGLRTPGAIMFRGRAGVSGIGHVEISMGNGQQTIGTRRTGTPASITNSTKWTHWGMAPGVDYTGTVGANTGPTDATTSGLGGGTGSVTPPVPTGPDTPQDSKFEIDRLFNGQAFVPALAQSAQTAFSDSLAGVRALMNDEPILGYIKNLMNMSMRSFCSAPNGDFMAWFPDYYGIWGTAAKMVVRPIELMDFNVTWSDDYLVTHQYVTADWASNFDVPSGDVSSAVQDPAVSTVGIASIDFRSVMSALFGIEPVTKNGELFSTFYYERFGARPSYQEAKGIYGPKGEFFMALFLFMRQWAYQYNADVPVTFMPEVWPGMLLQLPEFNFQAYVTTVTHTGSFGEGGGFNTSVNISSPAQIDKKDGVLLGLPLAGGYKDPKAGPPTVAALPSSSLQRNTDPSKDPYAYRGMYGRGGSV